MADEFPETDLETPTEDDLDEAYGSIPGWVDIGDKKIRTKILKVRMEEMKDRETGKMKKRPSSFSKTSTKRLILNATNKNSLVDAFGKAPAGWLNATVGILRRPKRDVWRQENRRRASARAASSCGGKPAAKPASRRPNRRPRPPANGRKKKAIRVRILSWPTSSRPIDD